MKKITGLILIVLMSFSLSSCSQKNANDETIAIIHTDMGDMKVKLYNETPAHRDNFIKLAKQGWYDGSTFHRVIEGFMIQGGKSAEGEEGPGYRIDAEFVPGFIHKKGALAAARQSDQVNPEKKSSGSQFYIVQGRTFTDQELDYVEKKWGQEFTDEQREIYKTEGGSPHLDGEYSVFGQLIEGYNVLDKIAAVQINNKMENKPVQDIKMTIEIVE